MKDHKYKKDDKLLFMNQIECVVESTDGHTSDGIPCYRIGNNAQPGQTSLGNTKVNEHQITLIG